MSFNDPASFRILLADDHAVVRRGLREMLSEDFPNATFGEAASAQEALEQAWATPWELIILDISMPGRSGLDVVHDLKAAQPKTPILVQSMHGEEQFAMRVLKKGAAGYVTKESVPDELRRAVHKVLGGGRYVSESLAEKMVSFLASDGAKPAYESLSDREFDILRRLAGGAAIKEIAAQLSLSHKTISTYRSRILQKLDLRTNRDIVQFAIREGLLE